ncbi:hypothetical protein ACO34A_24605 (plasmid) [Rhizobium sp. ACO-34A]|nr:MFS transporter [Rhizobium sp. ACO-34A]ATN36957.1 hypothetical protein ACO34A_24605 [Rhizobium sp. ACO-34A]
MSVTSHVSSANISLGDALQDKPLLPAIWVLCLSFIVVMLDGYDLLCVSFVAKPMADALGTDVARFGAVFGAGYTGVLIGGMFIGPLGDRHGRKSILLLSVALFGAFSLAPIFDLHYERLLVYRFVTGLGLGGALPCVAALTAETAPRKRRGLFVSLMYGGVATGGVVGGFLASRLIPHYGWESAFWIGGAAPLILLPILWLLLPETMRQEARGDQGQQGGHSAAIDRVRELFRGGRGPSTVFLWGGSFFALMSFGALVSWLPVMISQVGLDQKQAILGPVMVNLGGILGTILIGILLNRLGMALAAAANFLAAAVGLVLFSQLLGPGNPAFPVIFFTGLFLLGSVNTTNSIMASFYPGHIRATGSGWGLGMGRIGGIIGPVAGGSLLAQGLAVDVVLIVIGMAAAMAGLSMFVFGLTSKNLSSQGGPNGA